jgi:AmmeMemoRadiSam system protein B/AmmeMemoRadiSam system protein A
MNILRLSLTLSIIGLCLAAACQADNASHADVREPAVAGKFYPNSAAKLRLAIEKFLRDAVPAKVKKPVAIVVPHAGYTFSGQICADGFKQVSHQSYDVVVILGTNHTSPDDRKISLYSGGGFRTPLGTASIERNVVLSLVKANPDDCTLDKSLHEHEHSIEVIVPFIQVLFPEAKIVPAVVGSPDMQMCTRFGKALALVLKNKRALIVASSDLSHYPAAEHANRMDRETLAAMTTLDPAAFLKTVHAHMDGSIPALHTRACGEAPIMAAMAAARSLGAGRGVVVSYANSGDVPVGERSRVVGYGSVAFAADQEGKEIGKSAQSTPVAASATLRSSDKKTLLSLARKTLTRIFLTDTVPLARGCNANLQQPRGVFVTLRNKGELRGCIGRMVGDEPLCKLVSAMAIQAAFHDSRFRPLGADEMKDITIEISVLTPMKPVAGASDIVVGRDGVLLRKKGRSAVFLPQVPTEQGWDRDEMLDHLCLKAGLTAGCWREEAQLSTFQAVVFSESEFSPIAF